MDLYIKLNTEKEEDLKALKSLTDKLTGETVSVVDIAPWPEMPVENTPKSEEKGQKSEKNAQETTENAQETTENEATYTIDDIRKYLIELKNAKGEAAAKAVLTEFAVSKTTDLPEDRFAEVVERIAKELN
jgi:hypothetical protein